MHYFLFFSTHKKRGGGWIIEIAKLIKVNHFIIMLKFIDATFNALFFSFLQQTQKTGGGGGTLASVSLGGGALLHLLV